MNPETLVSINVGLPVVSALALLVLNDKRLRTAIVSLSSLILVSSSFLLYQAGGVVFSPGHIFEQAVVILDFALLLYFLYVGLKAKSPQVVLLGLAQIIPAAYFEFVVKGTHVENIMVVDSLSILLTLIINIIGSVVVIYALTYMDEHEHHLQLEKSNQNRFFFYMIMLLAAMNGLVYSNSLYWIYFFWEITTLCCYELIRHDMTEEAIQNSILALWMGLVGGVALIGTMFVSYYTIGNISLSELLVATPGQYVLLAFALMAIAAFTKSAQLPFQGWLLGAMVAPTPVSALLHSSTMVNIGVYTILRIAPAIHGTYLTYGIAFVGIFSFLITSIIALSQKLSKKILAYSTVGNLGLMIFCAAMNTSLSYSAAIILLVFHAMSKGLLFMCAGIIENRLHTRAIEDWAGLITRLPITAKVMMLGIVSMFLPLFGVLLGKWAAIGITTSAPSILGMVMVAMMVIGSSATTLFWAKWLGSFVITPLVKGTAKNEELSAGYKLSLYGVLGLNILTSLGSGYVIKAIVTPIVEMNYQLAWNIDILTLHSQVGDFMILPLWGALVAIVILGNLLISSKGGEIKPPYLSGENVEGNPIGFRTTADSVVEYNVAGMFFDSEITEARWVPLSTIAGILLNLALLALVML